LAVLLVSLCVFVAGRYLGLDADESRTMAFATLIVANLSLILTNVSWSRSIIGTLRSPNQAMWWVVGGAFLFLGLVLYVPFLSQFFRFKMLSIREAGICLVAGMASIVWFEVLKLVLRLRRRALITER
jgi:Ca2+-transporting ATPase